jgi:hypothetical protein
VTCVLFEIGCKGLIYIGDDVSSSRLPSGHSTTGCVNFTIPTGVTVTKVLYDPPKGTKGQWDVH